MKQSGETDVIVVGNGIIAYSIAFALVEKDPAIRVTLIGPTTRPACASIAAGAMLNSFAEIEDDSLAHEASRAKFAMNRAATGLWPAWVARLNGALGEERVKIIEGTYVLHNASTDGLDDRNFQAILEALREWREPFEDVLPTAIVGLRPEARNRPLRAIYIPGEGAVRSTTLLQAFDDWMAAAPAVTCLDANAVRITVRDSGALEVATDDDRVVTAGRLLLAGGARTQELIDQIPLLKERVPRLFHGVGIAMLLRTRGDSPERVVRTPNRGMACGVHVVPYDRDFCYVGATNVLSPVGDDRPRMTGLYGIMQAAMTQINTNYFQAHLERVLVGSRPMTTDGFPLIGETSIPGLWLVTGTRREGLHLSPLVGQSIAARLTGGLGKVPPAFAPERAPIWTLTREEGIEKAVRHLKSSGYQHELRLPNNGWEAMIDQMLRQQVETIYERCGIKDHGVPPETLGMYQEGLIHGG